MEEAKISREAWSEASRENKGMHSHCRWCVLDLCDHRHLGASAHDSSDSIRSFPLS